MGKRKLHGVTYFQCDWTGLPMRQTNCYMPDWNENGKLLKHGSYTCWEAVLAHAEHQLLNLTDDVPLIDLPARSAKLKRIQEYINDLVGCHVYPAPSWEALAWFARNDEGWIHSPKHFLEICSVVKAPVVAVRIPAVDSVHEVLCNAEDVRTKFASHLTQPFNTTESLPQSFQTVRKKANKDRDLTVFYWPFKNGLPFNSTASSAFKMQIYGDALVVQQSKEPCFLPRERYVNYDLPTFNDQFNTKQKRKDHTTTLSTDEYELAKAQMSSELQSLEAAASANASLPAELAKAAILPAPTGAELADLLRARGQSPPLKKVRKVVHAVALPVDAEGVAV